MLQAQANNNPCILRRAISSLINEMKNQKLPIQDKKPDLDGVASASLTATNASAGTMPSGQGALPSDPSDGVIATAQSSLDSTIHGLEKPFPKKRLEY